MKYFPGIAFAVVFFLFVGFCMFVGCIRKRKAEEQRLRSIRERSGLIEASGSGLAARIPIGTSIGDTRQTAIAVSGFTHDLPSSSAPTDIVRGKRVMKTLSTIDEVSIPSSEEGSETLAPSLGSDHQSIATRTEYPQPIDDQPDNQPDNQSTIRGPPDDPIIRGPPPITITRKHTDELPSQTIDDAIYADVSSIAIDFLSSGGSSSSLSSSTSTTPVHTASGIIRKRSITTNKVYNNREQ